MLQAWLNAMTEKFRTTAFCISTVGQTSSSADYVTMLRKLSYSIEVGVLMALRNANAILKGQLAAGMVEMTDDELNKRSSKQKEIIEEMQSYRDGRDSTLSNLKWSAFISQWISGCYCCARWHRHCCRWR